MTCYLYLQEVRKKLSLAVKLFALKNSDILVSPAPVDSYSVQGGLWKQGSANWCLNCDMNADRKAVFSSGEDIFFLEQCLLLFLSHYLIWDCIVVLSAKVSRSNYSFERMCERLRGKDNCTLSTLARWNVGRFWYVGFFVRSSTFLGGFAPAVLFIRNGSRR